MFKSESNCHRCYWWLHSRDFKLLWNVGFFFFFHLSFLSTPFAHRTLNFAGKTAFKWLFRPREAERGLYGSLRSAGAPGRAPGPRRVAGRAGLPLAAAAPSTTSVPAPAADTWGCVSGSKATADGLGSCPWLRQFWGERRQPRPHRAEQSRGLARSRACTAVTAAHTAAVRARIAPLSPLLQLLPFIFATCSWQFSSAVWKLGITSAHRTYRLLSYLNSSSLVWAAGCPFIQVWKPREYLTMTEFNITFYTPRYVTIPTPVV